MRKFKAPKWIRLIILLVISYVVWGTIGFIIGGWHQSFILGIVGGLASTFISSFLILRSDSKGSRGTNHNQ